MAAVEPPFSEVASELPQEINPEGEDSREDEVEVRALKGSMTMVRTRTKAELGAQDMD